MIEVTICSKCFKGIMPNEKCWVVPKESILTGDMNELEMRFEQARKDYICEKCFKENFNIDKLRKEIKDENKRRL